MRRNAFVMQLKPGNEDEYKRRHDAIWPELVKELEDAGISDYTISLHRPTGMLFASQKVKDHDTTALLPGTPVVKRWWASMADLMETNPDNSPKTTDLVEVFHLD